MLALRPKQNTFIGTMTPQVFLDLDEKGAVAAAVTTMLGSVVVTGHITKPPPIPFFVDHPVVFRIRDKQTGTILFAGRVASPTSR